LLAYRGAPALLNQASPEYCAKPTTRFRRADRQGILIAIGEEKKCIRFDQIAPVIESPFHFAMADRFYRDWLSEFRDMAISTGAGYHQVSGPGAIGLTFSDVRCLFQRTPAKLANGEKRVPDFLARLCRTVWKVKVEQDMTSVHKMALVGAFGVIAGGLAAAQAIHAQQAKAPPAFVIAEVEKDPAKIEDPAASRRYAEEAPKSLAPFNGQYLVRAGGSKIQTLEGEAPKGYIVVIGFESVEKAREWYHSPAYEAIKPIRQNSTKSRIFIVEGESAQ